MMNFYDIIFAKKTGGGGGGGSLPNPKVTIKLVNNSGSNVNFKSPLNIINGELSTINIEVANGTNKTVEVYAPDSSTEGTTFIFPLPSEWVSAISDDEVNCANLGDGNIYIADGSLDASCTLELS